MRSYKVTKINDSRSGIYCDFTPQDQFGDCGEAINLLVSISDFYDAHLKEGKVITDECFEALYEASGIANARKKAEWILSGGDHSKKGLTVKLVKAGFDRPYAEKAALIMEEQGFIDEYRQAERLAKAYVTRKHWGKKRIMQNLLLKGYEKDAVQAAVSFITREEYIEALSAVMERKYPTPPEDKKEKDKRIAALMRLGFSLGEILETMQKLF